jgi:hypothetical protein
MGALSYKSQVIDPIVSTGLILNYDIQNTDSYSGSGTAVVDLMGNSNATLTAGPTYSSAGPRYILFNGSTQYLMTNTSLNSKLSPVNTSIIISFFTWVYPQGDGVIISEQGTTPPNTGWYDAQIQLYGGTMYFNVWNNNYATSKVSSSIATPLNAWHYVGITYDGTTLRAYVNGAAAGSNAIARLTPGNDVGGRSLLYNIAGACPTNMGPTQSDGTASNMRLGAFQVYNVALTAAQVLANYNATRATYGR